MKIKTYCSECGHSQIIDFEGSGVSKTIVCPECGTMYGLHVEEVESSVRQKEGGNDMTSTPWGASQDSKKYAPGITEYSTASHGGFHLSKSRQEAMPNCLRNESGWYEEDCEWCKVAIAFPDFFKPQDLISAWDTLKGWHYKAYEKITGVVLRPGESHAKDEVLFFEKHKNDWIVISALRCEHDNTLVDVTATKGGKRSQYGQRKDYIVTAEAYDKRDRFGFVITDQEEVNHAD